MQTKNPRFFSRRTLLVIVNGATLAGFVISLAACQLSKSWWEPHFQRHSLAQVGEGWLWETRTVASAEGGILLDTQTTRYLSKPGGSLVVRPWYGVLHPPGYANGGQAVPFPQNLWIESSSSYSLNPSAGIIAQTDSFLRVPWWPFIALFGAWPTVRVLAWARARRYADGGGCPECGYDLRHSPHRCPECGRAVDSPGAAAVA